jgi:hypothetical protein
MSSKKIWGSIAICLLLLIFLIRIPTIAFHFQNQTIYTMEKSFDLSWIHSVEKEEWIEHYIIKSNELLLESTSFKTFGAGVPSDGENVELKNGYVVMTIEQPYEQLNLTISEYVNTTIHLAQQEMKLYKYGEPYETVLIKVEKLSVWQFLRGNFYERSKY